MEVSKETEQKIGQLQMYEQSMQSFLGQKQQFQVQLVETEQRKLHKCPYCSKVAVKRVSLGIWQCRKCNVKFAGKAYSITRKIVAKDEAEEMIEEPQAMEEDQAETQEVEE